VTDLRSARVVEHRHRGEPAVTLEAGELTATFLPHVGMTGVSLRFRDREHLALPGGIAALRAGTTSGLPLLAPWANRLATRRFCAAGVGVDLRRVRLRTDAHGLPIHGLLVGRSGWAIDRVSTSSARATVEASIEVDASAFPFPHRLELSLSARDGRLDVATTLVATGRRRVPVAFGWHPYLRLPGVARGRWRLRLPARRHLLLDDRGIPTGAVRREITEREHIGVRTYDDLYALGRDRSLALEADDGAAVELRCGTGYPYAQVWVPTGRPFAALEPMTAPTNALVDGTAPVVAPGSAFTARFSLLLSAPCSSQ
jgi:galactose mutarotase-like enzyme